MQIQKKNNTLFWKLNLNGSEIDSYLFGTMHLIPKIHFSLPQTLSNALKKCERLYLEMNISGDKERAIIESQSMNTSLISDQLSDDENAELNMILNEKYGMTLDQINHLHPMAVINLLINQPFSEEEVIAVESDLIQIAQENEIKIKGLETAKAQMKMGNLVFTSQELLRQLKQPFEADQVMEDTVRAYLLQDIDGLASAAKDPRLMSEKAQNILLTKRNKAWAKKIPLLMEKQIPLFFAVGAGHLGGTSGLIELLKQNGVQIQPLALEWKEPN